MLARARRESTEMSLQMTLEPKPTISAVQERRADRDRELVEALRLHEPTAAERLVATYGDRAYRLATGITGNAQDAEEIVQDVFWAVVRKIDTFRGESAFGSWLYRIVANAAYQKLRGQRSRGRDRKSTRLNSSHLVISYAVFCLKKKKKRKTSTESVKE